MVKQIITKPLWRRTPAATKFTSNRNNSSPSWKYPSVFANQELEPLAEIQAASSEVASFLIEGNLSAGCDKLEKYEPKSTSDLGLSTKENLLTLEGEHRHDGAVEEEVMADNTDVVERSQEESDHSFADSDEEEEKVDASSNPNEPRQYITDVEEIGDVAAPIENEQATLPAFMDKGKTPITRSLRIQSWCSPQSYAGQHLQPACPPCQECDATQLPCARSTEDDHLTPIRAGTCSAASAQSPQSPRYGDENLDEMEVVDDEAETDGEKRGVRGEDLIIGDGISLGRLLR
ncbi:hypothetical protein HK102_011886 [Quaeritorhiza haematococci]|nr:hypothetical protein HK102_011886 [Quaeritorhiza haematococci]